MAAGASDWKAASAWTRKMAGVVLSLALRHAVRLKLIPHNPAADVAKPRPVAREMLYLNERQSRWLLEAAKTHRLSALVALALGSGMGQGETCMIVAGCSVMAVSRRLGHADITITLKAYAHVMPNDDDKLAAAAHALFGS